MADEPKAEELVGGLPKRSRRRKGSEELEKKRVPPLFKRHSLAEARTPANRVKATEKQKGHVMESGKKEAAVLTVKE